MTTGPILLGYPVEDKWREQLRRMVGVLAVVVPDSVQRRCQGCEILVWLGPRQAAMPGDAYCPWCALSVAGDFADVVSLGNPDSRLEP